MNAIGPIVLVLIGLGIVSGVVIWAIARGPKRQARFIESLVLTQEASLAEGPVQLEGTALPEVPLKAPLSGEDALAWQLSIGALEEVGDGNSKQFCAVTPVTCMASFKIRLGQTEILVSGEPHHIVTATYDTSATDTRLISALPDEARQTALAAIGAGAYRYDVPTDEPAPMKEHLIRPGGDIFVLGCARWSSEQKQWHVGPGAHRPLVLVEGTRRQFLHDLRSYRRGLHVEYPLR